ncbi:MAG: hypothetical protein M3Y91_15305 [Actinomycetota bacterium]|nr:hypothetical protein [Actinomycetota bacterium]
MSSPGEPAALGKVTGVTFTAVPRATVPARRAHRRARFLLAGVAAGPVLALMALAVAAGGRTGPAVTAGVGHDRAFAELAAQDYLAARPTALPYAQGLDPSLGRDSSVPSSAVMASGTPGSVTVAPIAVRSLAWRSADEGRVGARPYEVDTFVVATADALWHLSVEIIDSASGPVIGADPSLTPDPTAPADVAAAITYGPAGGSGQSDLGPGATRQVQAWAQAYADGDGATLYRLTGDTRSDTYPSLQGWVFDRVTLGASAVKSGVALAQVQVVMHQVNDPSQSVTCAYDLLLGHLGQSLPFVQAWGPAGSGPTLVAYRNALPVTSSPVPSAPATPVGQP